jgi:uncharacterized membrane protein YfcA
MDILTFFLLVLLAIVAGLIGAILGLGGGIIIVPGLTLLFHYDVKIAIATSLVSVIATSSAAATVYVAERLTNIRLGMTLEVATTIGALAGGLTAVYISGRYLYFIFAAVLIYAGVNMIRRREASVISDETIASESSINGSFTDPTTGKTVCYAVDRIPTGMLGSAGAGILSGLLGVGGGIIKVPLMNLVMRIPMKACIATSNFMIGVTAATGALVYWSSGLVNPVITAPVAIGVIIGARLGTMMVGRMHTRALRLAFVVLIAITAVQMVLRGVSIR